MLNDYRIVQRIIDDPQPDRTNLEQELARVELLQSRRHEILSRWDYEESQEARELAKSKANLNTCLWLCLLAVGIYALPFFAIKYDNLKTTFKKKKKYRDYMRQLSLEQFFQELEMDLQRQRMSGEEPYLFFDRGGSQRI